MSAAGDRPIKVAFTGTALMAPLTGIGQYTHQLALGLREVPGIELRLFYATHFSSDVRSGAAPAIADVRRAVRSTLPFAYELERGVKQAFFSLGAASEHFDLYHEPNFLAYRFRGPSVVTVHDLSWIRYPETHPAERVRAMHKYFQPGLERASLVLSDSEFVKAEIVKEFGIAADRVETIPLGLDPAFSPRTPEQTREVLAAHSLEHGSYFLCVGTLEPRKNIAAAIRAYSSLAADVRSRSPLAIAGMRGWRTSSLDALLEPLIASGAVRVLGYVSRGDLVAITAGAMALVYPSLYEGFGLPPLEAMGCGVAVIASNVSSLPELVADAALTVDPHDVDALGAAMAHVAGDASLRADLCRRGLQRAAEFTWERCVAATVQAYLRASSMRR